MKSAVLFIILIMLFASNNLWSQTETIITSTIHSIISGYTEYNRNMDRSLYKSGNEDYKTYNIKWHRLETAETIAGFSVGISIGSDFLKSNENYYTLIKRTALSGIIRWVVLDGTYNLSYQNNFFHRSKATGWELERFGTPLVKISLLIVILIWNYLDF